jgi:hypothetical protein
MLIETKKLAALAAIVVVGSLLLVKNCFASANEYSLSQTINVAILRMPSSTIPGNSQSGSSPGASLPAPYIFDILNNRPDIKPPLWHLKNPMAPVAIDTEIESRFYNIYTANAQVLPNMAPYWEVDFNKISSAAQLAQFNLLYIRDDAPFTMTMAQRSILRQFVDCGGTLWIDSNMSQLGTSPKPTNSLPLANIFRVFFSGASTGATPATYHPITTSPYSFTPTQLAALGYGSNATSGQDGSLELVNSVSTPPTSPDTSEFQLLDGSMIAGDYGSGHVIIDGLGIGDYINEEPGAYLPSNTPGTTQFAYDQTAYSSVSDQNLEFLVDVISYATSSESPGGNPRGSNVQGGNVGGSVTSSWDYFNGTTSARIIPVGMATYGKFVYTTDNLGNLNCFDVNPPESIFTDAKNGDDGATDPVGSSYDLIWTVAYNGPATTTAYPISAPVVALVPYNGVNTPVVMIEDADGNVLGYPATYDPGPGGSAPSTLFKYPQTANSTAMNDLTGAPPAPCYYRGQIIAAQPQSSALGEVGVFDLSTTGENYSFPLDFGDWVQPLMAASIPSTDGQYNGNDIVGYAVLGEGVETFELGSRDEQLLYSAGSATNTGQSSYTSHASKGQTSSEVIYGAPEDTLGTSYPNDWLLDFNTALTGPTPVPPFYAVDTSAGPANASLITADEVGDTLYADYNLNIPGTAGTTPLRTEIQAEEANGQGGVGSLGLNNVQGASVGPDSTVYMTVNSPSAPSGTAYIESVTEQNPGDSHSNINWRFELNNQSDAKGVTYNFLGDAFFGAPVPTNNGVVYAVANDLLHGGVDVFAFNTHPEVGFTSPSFNGPYTISQTDEYGAGELVSSGGSQITGGNQFTSFGPGNTTPLRSNLYAPGTVNATQAIVNGTGQSQGGLLIDTAFNNSVPMLEWYTNIPAEQATSAPRLIGNYLYFGVSSSTTTPATASTVAVYDNPAGIGLSASEVDRGIAYNSDYRFVQFSTSRLPSINLPPVGTDKYIVTAGAGNALNQGGFEGLSYNTVLVADGNRLIEMDPAGNATWTLDSTQQTTPVGAAITGGPSPTFITAGGAETSVQLNRPSTVTQLNLNDYLIADTGNNRCVHADRLGNVLTQLTDSQGNTMTPTINGVTYGLEISSFSDPLGVLPAGQPLTLSRPNSVVTWLTYDYGSTGGTKIKAINVHYLIADTGNSRVLDVVDRYINSGASTNFVLGSVSDFHYLNWESHTTDVGGRPYDYTGAEPIFAAVGSTTPSYAIVYPDNSGSSSQYLNNQAVDIIAVESNKWIPSIVATGDGLSTVDQDSNGSSVLELDYANGQPYATVASGTPVGLINSVAYGTYPAAAGVQSVIPLRGLRSAIAVSINYSSTPPGVSQMVVADDDGVFSGTLSSASTNYAGALYPYTLDASYGATSVGWSFVQSDYTNAVTAYDSSLDATQPLTNPVANHMDYKSTSFVPASAIELTGNNYLIVNRGASQNQNAPGTAGQPDNGFGGNVFIVHATTSQTGPIDSLDGPMYGKPANTGPLSAPSFALQSY